MGTGRPTGRPSKLNHRITVAGVNPEDPPRTLTCAEFIYEHMEATGRSAHSCAALIPVDRHTIQGWLSAGTEAENHKTQGWTLNRTEQEFLDFLTRTRRAHSLWIADRNRIVASLASGGLQETKEVIKVDPTRQQDGTPMQPGGVPFVLERKVETKRLLPDLAAVKLQLERLARDEWSPRIEVTGADGGPLDVDVSTREQRVRETMAELDELDAFLAGAAAATDRESADTGT